MQAPHRIGAIEIGERAGNAQGAVPGAGGEAQPFGSTRQQCATFGVWIGDCGQELAVGVGVAPRPRPATRPVGQQAGAGLRFDLRERGLELRKRCCDPILR